MTQIVLNWNDHISTILKVNKRDKTDRLNVARCGADVELT